MAIIDDGLTRVDRCTDAVAVYTAADKQTYNLFDWFYANVGRFEAVRPAATVATYYGVPAELFNTLWWTTRSTRILNKLWLSGDAVGFWQMIGLQRDRARAQLIVNFLNDIAVGVEL